MRAWRRDGRERTPDGETLVRIAARKAVANALRDGRLVREPCQFILEAGGMVYFCGRFKVQAHHDDYRKPLAVRWLCPPHHRRVDREIGRRK